LIGLDEISYGGDFIAGDPDVTTLNPLSFIHFKLIEVQSCEVDLIPAPFKLA
jgi:hypothetical protein